MGRRLKYLIIILFLLVLYSLYYWGIPFVANIFLRNGVIEKSLQKETGINFIFEKPSIKMGILPSIWMFADGVSVKDGDIYPLQLSDLKLEIKLLPLLLKRVDILYFSSENVFADTKLDKKYRFYIGKKMFIQSSESKITLENAKMDVNSYKIHLKDEANNKNILLNGAYFNLDKYTLNKALIFSTNSQVNINGKVSTINANVDLELPLEKAFNDNKLMFDGVVTNLDLSEISPYLALATKNKIRKVNGKLNFQADTSVLNKKTRKFVSQLAIDNFSIVNQFNKSVNFSDKLRLLSDFSYTKKNLCIDKFDFKSGLIDVSLSGNIDRINTKNPDLDVNLSVKNTRSEEIIALLPDIDIDTMNIQALKKYVLYSDVNGELRIEGKSEKPTLKGKFVASNAYVLHPMNIPKATITLDFRGKNMLLDVVVPTSVSEKVFVKGDIELYDKKETLLDISSTQNVDLKTTQIILTPIHEVLLFDIGPVPVMDIKGLGNIKLKTFGNTSNPHLFGQFNFKNANVSFNGINALITNGSGALEFKDNNTYFYTKQAYINSMPVSVKGTCTLNGELDYKVSANGQYLSTLLSIFNNSPMLADVQDMTKFTKMIKSTAGKTNFNMRLSGRVHNINDFKLGKNINAEGDIKLLGNTVGIMHFQTALKNILGNIHFKNNDVDFDLYPIAVKKRLQVKGKIRDSKIFTKVKLDNFNFVYKDIPVKIIGGNVELQGDMLQVYKVNALIEEKPVLIDGSVNNLFSDMNFNLYMSSKTNQAFTDKYLNKHIIYPLLTKGDINYYAKLEGKPSNFNVKSEIKMQEGASIYYMGATLGDMQSPIKIYLDAQVTPTYVNVNNFQYDKLISSQNNRDFASHQLNAKGRISLSGDDIYLNNFNVRTQIPTDARLFNIMFKKPLIKQGNFTSNIVVNGYTASPKIIGKLNFNGVNIPFLNTMIKDIHLSFNDKIVDMSAKGEVFSNDISLNAKIRNSFKLPVVIDFADVYLGNLSVDSILNQLNKLELDAEMHKLGSETKNSIVLSDFVINKSRIWAKSIAIKNIFAKDFYSDLSFKNSDLKLDNFRFKTAEGSAKGDFSLNKNKNINLNLVVDEMNANTISSSMFDLPNQICGSLTGQTVLTCNGKTHKQCLKTLTGRGNFVVQNGRMPKLGSLEYLLKAANLIKSGITGVTINSIVDILTPLKTGNFESINGMYRVNSGFANEVQIFSRGKNLSIFINGTYNFDNSIADMEVFGRVSKKISNALGIVGNTSLNTLFNIIPGVDLDSANKGDILKNINKVPGFELNDKTYRVFSSKIYGDINGDDYVQSFKWVE